MISWEARALCCLNKWKDDTVTKGEWWWLSFCVLASHCFVCLGDGDTPRISWSENVSRGFVSGDKRRCARVWSSACHLVSTWIMRDVHQLALILVSLPLFRSRGMQKIIDKLTSWPGSAANSIEAPDLLHRAHGALSILSRYPRQS